MREIIAFFAKIFYRNEYTLLRSNLLFQKKQLEVLAQNHSELLIKLLISGEDHRFRYHIGFDIIAIIRAFRNRILYRKIEGASTIEQQLVRVLTNNFEKTVSRKIQEIFLATTVTSIIPKQLVPKIYLEVAYYGAGMNGLQQAAYKIGISDIGNLTLHLAAELVARIKYPQPKETNIKRQKQIETRRRHLISLHSHHSSKTFLKIYD